MKEPSLVDWSKYPKPKVEIGNKEANNLQIAVGKIRDTLNRELVTYWTWSQVKDLSFTERLQLVMAAALDGSLKGHWEEDPDAGKPRPFQDDIPF